MIIFAVVDDDDDVDGDGDGDDDDDDDDGGNPSIGEVDSM